MPSMNIIFTGRNEVVAKVMFLHVCVILFTGGVSRQGEPPPRQGEPPLAGRPPHWEGRPPLRAGRTPQAGRTPLPRSRHPPGRETTPPGRENPPYPRAGRNPPGADTPQSRLQHTVYEWPVCILLECILVNIDLMDMVGDTFILVKPYRHLHETFH